MNNSKLKISTLNCNGLRTKTRRRAMLKQLFTHSNVVCLQETYADGIIMNQISTEFPGYWIAAHAHSAHSTGVAIGVTKTYGLTRTEADDYVDESNQGRMVGMALTSEDGTKYFIISVYSPCLDRSNQEQHYEFLLRISTLVAEKRSKGYEPLVFGDFNCIRDKQLDAKNGGEVYKRQSIWFNKQEATADLHDVQRYLHPNEYLESWSHGRKNSLKRFRRLDYILASRSMMGRVSEVTVTPTLSDHRMLTVNIANKAEKIGGPGYWQHPDFRLKEQHYKDQIEFAIEEGMKTKSDLTDKRAYWDWLKFCSRAASIRICKKASKERREERQCLEDLYAIQLKKMQRTPLTPQPDWRSTTVKTMLLSDSDQRWRPLRPMKR
jgi:exonuclease III